MKAITSKIETNGTTGFLTLHFLIPFSLTEKETYGPKLMSKDQPIETPEGQIASLIY
jgi:hypothetical protein